MITLYGFPRTRATRISWLLEELDLDYDYQLINFNTLQHRSPDYLALNPGGKVPAVRVEGQLITESGAIVTFLADKYAEKGFIPAAGTLARVAHDQWSYFALSELEQPLWTQGKHKFALPKEQRVAEIFPTAEWEFQRALRLFSQGLGDQPYILGSDFQAVDVLLGHTLLWGLSFKQPIEQSNLQAYIERCKARPALQRAQAREKALLESLS
ncbi:MAG: glutathione S-transferase family protein [Gammaproteobacteria bacterium]|nr:glutathione S-transferase family protein [Gammaproteobacteria bacterium]